MRPITFLFGIHNHQPVGNFESVLEAAYQSAYKPFLDVLERHPGVRLALHNSGILLDWFEARHPEHLERLAALVRAGQVEPLTGGYYEPILPAVPDSDKVGQIRKMNDWIGRRFGAAPTGLWLTERVWEPSLAGPLVDAGVRYLMVDDAHFLAAGADAGTLWNYWLTEDQGKSLAVWPISKRLRYLVPFEPPEKTIEFLRELAAGGENRVALLADDGEKFGVWPDTHRQVYENGWLDKFFGLLEKNAAWLTLGLPGPVTAGRPPEGRIYLPTASYSEMMEWALPTPVQAAFHRYFEKLDHDGAPEARFVRGGFWRNFLAKYPESNLLHKRMLDVRSRLDDPAVPPDVRAAALDDVWQSQCNCAYWHGVFGGLYLPHLREGLYKRILSAETRLDAAASGGRPFLRVTTADLDRDGHDELRLVNRSLGVLLAPARGGALEELDFFPRLRNLSHGLTRRPEAYHDRLRAAAQATASSAAGEGSVRSIHDRVETKEPGLETKLQYDWYRRLSLLDHFFRADTTADLFERAQYGEQGDFIERPYAVESVAGPDEAEVRLVRAGQVWVGGRAWPLQVEKTLRMTADRPEVTVAYRLTHSGDEPVPLWFGVEFNFTMLGGDTADRYYRIDGRPPAAEPHLAGRGTHEAVRAISLHDEWETFSVHLGWTRPAALWRLPVDTISQSEAGFERVYQSSCVVPHWSIRLEPGQAWSVAVTLRLDDRA